MKIGININDYISAKKSNWSINTNGYLRNNKTKEYLHTFILGKKEGFVCDHINRDKLDNRRSNLRHVTRYENNLNTDMCINAKGIYYDSSGNRWRACISVKIININLCSF